MMRTKSAFARACAVLALLFLDSALEPAAAAESRYDLVLRNARVVDGTGSPWYRADIAVQGDTIVRIAPLIAEPANRVIDLGGMVATPGFIDIHTHASRDIFQVPTADNYVRQGVTTLMEGVDGGGGGVFGGLPVPVKPFLDRLEATPRTVNLGTFIGQGAVRESVVGMADRAATPGELDRMRAVVRQGIHDGAFGLSTGLFYIPGKFTPMSEVIELQKLFVPYRGVHTSHMRDEAGGVVDSVKETITIGERAGVPTHVSHHKVIGKANWGRSVETLKLIDDARARGVDVTIDQYPYTASSTTVQAALLPGWALDGGLQQAIARIKDPAIRPKIKAAVANLILTERGGGDPRNVVIVACAWDASLAGKNLAEITSGRGQEPTLENSAESVLWLIENGGCRGVYHAMGEEDLQRILAHRATMIASDGQVAQLGRDSIHPRSYGTFARVLAVYVRDKGILTLEEAVRKMSSFPAARIGLPDRGVLRPGMKADIAVFDPARVRDAATFDRPHQYAEGFAYVMVNGQMVYEDGKMTPARPGRVLYGPGKGPAMR